MDKRKFINSVSDRLEIPRDVIGNEARITLMGNGLIHIEGFSGILEYDEAKTLIGIKDGVVGIYGKDITISLITEEFIELKGDMKTIEFM